MGFFKDFENEIKIFFVLVALIIVAGWFGALSTVSFFRAMQEPEQSGAQQPSETQEEGVIPPEEQKQEEQEPQPSVPVYANESLGVSFEYPAGWFVYDTVAWEEDNAIAPCQTAGIIENTVIVSSKNLGRCVGVTEFKSWPGDMLISFAQTEWRDFPFVLEGENPGLVEVGGVAAAKYPYLENSSANRKQAVRLYVNNAGRGYIIEFTQADAQGNYDPVFDEILASLQWR